MSLKDKRILITAGPTWVAIDKVRVISNIATGETGVLLAQQLSRRGAKVTLILGPVSDCCIDNRVRLIRFRFFAELKNLCVKELKSKKYDIVIHSAAVSDYQPVKAYSRKLASGLKNLTLKLKPTEKLIDLIKKIAPHIFLVGFKFEPDTNKSALIKSTKTLVNRLRLDLAVANTINNGRYLAYILNHNKQYGPFGSKGGLTKRLINLIAKI